MLTMTSDTSPSPASPAARASAATGAKPARKKPVERPAAMAALHIGSGDPLLLLHGFLLSPHCWEQTATLMAAHCEVFAPALAGHWGGPDAPGRTIDIAALADAVERQLDEMGWRTCHIAGNSLGAWVGVELARRGRARTLTLIAPAGGWNVPSLTQFRVALKFLSLVPVTRLGARMADFAARNPVVRRLALFPVVKNPTAVARRDAVATVTAAVNCRAMVPLILGSLRAPALADLSDLATPVRLLLSEYDRVIPNRVYARRFLKELPDSADRILVNRVGHVPMLEAPDRIATLIAEHVYASRTRLRAV
ncbi:alpha/beta fold hydrolase [Nocardia farcinica]|nr:alpha/beta fold hydrolase [Nocardia farcinica]PEH79125.1 alpha/beta hydrolase [Nocardia sp. FDAARGOS_372]MBC9817486.1 alpha/beta fold hydrolase [Nocardia farcinica]MBF6138479.1 alpha/beta fold hydrolase [Nocardia farcinica]MBF6187590.1 alpha/beta fold hydrolase [Nocardia farcinica]